LNITKENTKITIKWAIEDIEDVEKARKYFMKLIRQGWIATKRNNKLQRILEFKPEHRELLFIPLSEGG